MGQCEGVVPSTRRVFVTLDFSPFWQGDSSNNIDDFVSVCCQKITLQYQFLKTQ